MPSSSLPSHHPNLIDDTDGITTLLAGTSRIAVLGMKTEAARGQPSFDVPLYAAERGFEIVPVPVYYPEATSIAGRKVFRRLADVSREVGPIDMVDVFRRSKDLAPHLEDILEAKPASVWLQSGIRDDDFAAALAEAGIKVVQDRCLLVELVRRPGLRPSRSQA